MTNNMNNQVIYIHGYGSNGNSETASGLRKHLDGQFEVKSPSYSWTKPLEALSGLEALFKLSAPNRPVIVGSSLGGFYANVLARSLNTPAILINPSLYPSKSLGKYGEGETTLREYAELEKKEASMAAKPERVVVLGMNDEVLDHRQNGLLLKDSVRTVLLNMGHRVQPEYYPMIARLVETIARKDMYSSANDDLSGAFA